MSIRSKPNLISNYSEAINCSSQKRKKAYEKQRQTSAMQTAQFGCEKTEQAENAGWWAGSITHE
jgi:hypothetical protein